MSQERLAGDGFARPMDRAYKRFVRAVEDAVESLSLGVAAGRCGLRSQDLGDMLAGHKGRRLPTDVGATIADMVSGDLRAAILDAVREMFGMWSPESDADYIRRLEDGYTAFGELGREQLARHRKAARRA